LFGIASYASYIAHQYLPKSVTPMQITQHNVITLSGTTNITHEVQLTKLRLPEFNPSLTIQHSLRCCVVNHCPYGIIFGCDFVTPIGIDILSSTKQVCWLEYLIDFRPYNAVDLPADIFHLEMQRTHPEEWLQDDGCYDGILETKCEAMEMDEVVQQ
jgi:hypothetical protein